MKKMKIQRVREGTGAPDVRAGEDTLSDIEAWYTEITGTPYSDRQLGRIARIHGFLRDRCLRLSDVDLIVNQDRAWTSRGNREPHEMDAVAIGSAGSPGKGGPGLRFYWIVRKPKAPGMGTAKKGSARDQGRAGSRSKGRGRGAGAPARPAKPSRRGAEDSSSREEAHS